MRTLKILVSGTNEDMRLERETVVIALESLRIEGARLEIEFASELATTDQARGLVNRCNIFLGVYRQTHYGVVMPDNTVSASEFEFEEAQRLLKPTAVFIKALEANEREIPQQSNFIDHVQNFDGGKLRVPEYTSLNHLKEQIAEAVMAILIQRFALKVTRPPFQVPRPLNTFVGRAHEIEQITQALIRGESILIHGLYGIGGIGKTELAIQIAHLVRHIFTDGILWANVPTLRPADTLTTWARMFGGLPFLGRGDLRFEFRPMTAEERQIEEVTNRVNEVRRLFQGKRLLVVLDGITGGREEENLAPLLRALDDTVVLLTSRTRQLRTLRKGTPIDLGCLTEDDALNLFTQMVGAERLVGKRALVYEIARTVECVPLALTLAAAQMREQPAVTPKTLNTLLRFERERLEEIKWGHGKSRAQRVALEQSYKQLTPDEQNFFDTLGVFAGDDFDVNAAAAVTENIIPVTRKSLDRLQRLAFVQHSPHAGRYKLHSVMQAFARSHLGERAAAAELRYASYYCEVAKENGRKVQIEANPDAMNTLTLESSNIFAAHHWAELRNDKVGWKLCRDFIHGAMTYYFNVRSMWGDWIQWSNAGIAACRKLGDERGAVAIAGSLGVVYHRKGELDQAKQFYQQALTTMERLGDVHGVATISMNLGTVETNRGAWNEAIVLLTVALQLHERLGDLRGTGQTHANLGTLYAKHGDKNKARSHWWQALEIFEHLDARNEADIVRTWLKKLPPEGRRVLE